MRLPKFSWYYQMMISHLEELQILRDFENFGKLLALQGVFLFQGNSIEVENIQLGSAKVFKTVPSF